MNEDERPMPVFTEEELTWLHYAMITGDEEVGSDHYFSIVHKLDEWRYGGECGECG